MLQLVLSVTSLSWLASYCTYKQAPKIKWKELIGLVTANFKALVWLSLLICLNGTLNQNNSSAD